MGSGSISTEVEWSFIQLGSSQSNASEVLEDCDLGVDLVEDDFGSVEIEAECVVELGSQRRQRIQLAVPLWRDGNGGHGEAGVRSKTRMKKRKMMMMMMMMIRS
jgi:hypothetical protein